MGYLKIGDDLFGPTQIEGDSEYASAFSIFPTGQPSILK